MIIKLQNNFEINVDTLNHTLREDSGSVDKDGNPNYKIHGYFNSIASALTKYVKVVSLRKHEELSIREYIEELRNTKQEIKEFIGELD